MLDQLDKVDHKPLLPPGLHSMNLSEIYSRCVESFSNNERRNLIFEKFSSFLSMLKDIPAEFEIWIDGSFTTYKENPSDIDVVIFASKDVINSLSSEYQQQLGYLIGNQTATKARFLTDAYFAISEDVVRRSYWRGWYCFDRNEEPKGAIKLEGIQ